MADGPQQTLPLHPPLLYSRGPQHRWIHQWTVFRKGGPTSTATCLASAHLGDNLILSIQGQERKKQKAKEPVLVPGQTDRVLAREASCLQFPPHGSMVPEVGRAGPAAAAWLCQGHEDPSEAAMVRGWRGTSSTLLQL